MSRPFSRAVVLIALAATFLPSEVLAGCARSNYPNGRNMPSVIRLSPTNLPPGLRDEFANGYGAWNSNSCNEGGASFSRFTEANNSGLLTIPVNYNEGLNPANSGSCGNHVTVGGMPGRIELYEFARDSSGRTIPCTRSDIFTDNVAHELGHALGLGDQTSSACGGRIMAQTNMGSNGRRYRQRSVRSDECLVVDDTTHTPGEDPPPSDPEDGEENDEAPDSPIVLDMLADGFEFSGLKGAVQFDIDADGTVDRLAWLAPWSNESFLFLDRNGNGQVDDGAELFGNHSPQPPSSAPNGYFALAVFDSSPAGGNGDGWITAADAIFSSLRLWGDGNRDGISQPWEIQTLSWAGVESLELRHFAAGIEDEYGNELRFTSRAYLTDGSLIPTVDVFFIAAK